MTPDEQTRMQSWVDAWKRAGPEMERMREEEVRRADTIRAFEAFAGMAMLRIQDHPPEPTSGLVEQQRWFRLAAAKEEQPGE